MIKCGNCKDWHRAVQEVRDCHGVGSPAPSSPSQETLPGTEETEEEFQARYDEMKRKLGNTATEKQQNLIERLISEREAEYPDQMKAEREKITGLVFRGQFNKKAASNTIDRLFDRYPQHEQKSVLPQAKALEGIPLGFYAIQSMTGNNDLDFFSVREHKESGNRYLRRVIGGRVDGSAVHRSVVAKVADRIRETGIDKARKTYAEEIGNCYVCNRVLTDEESRRHGIGPVCAGRQ